jgi:hypothetical protein
MKNPRASALRRCLPAPLAAAAILLAWAPGVMASHVGEEFEADQQTVASTDQLLGALGQYERMAPAQRTAALQRLTQLAAQRRERMLALLERNPKLAALRVLPATVRSRMPAQVAALLEREFTQSGTITATIADDFARGRSQQSFFIVGAAGERLQLRFADATEREMLAMVGKRGSVAGMQFDRQLLVLDKKSVLLAADGAQTTTTTTAASTTAVVQGNQSTLVVMLNFSDKALTCTADDLNNRLFGSSGQTMNVGYQQSSGNRVSFSGQVIGPFTINATSTDTCDHVAWSSAGNAAAIAAGFNPANFLRVSYAMPANSTCGWTGLATLGGEMPTRSWVQSCGNTGVFSHELGHNLRFNHAATPTYEYGDSSDPMGGARLVQSNAANRVMAGWLDASRIQDVSTGGSYALAALESSSPTSPQVLRLPKSDSAETYYVSLRQPVDLDTALPAGFHNTLSIHRSTGALPAKTFLQANVGAGQTWTDSVNGIQIRHDGVSGAAASVSVAFSGATCTRQAPSLAVSPASQSAAAGATLGYVLTIQNNNSAACPNSAFNLTQALPAGFAGSLGATSVSLASGASSNVGWNVASGSASADATYTLTANASDSATVGSAQAHGSYLVSTPLPPPPPAGDTAAPTVVITSPAAGATLSARGSTTISATASDNVGVASVQFLVDGKLLATTTSAPYSASWNLRKAGRGSHTLSVRAFDAAGNATTQTTSVTVK